MAKKELAGLVTKYEFFRVKDGTHWITEQPDGGGILVSDETHNGKVWCKVESMSEFYQLLFDYNTCMGIQYTETEEEMKIRTGTTESQEENYEN